MQVIRRVLESNYSWTVISGNHVIWGNHGKQCNGYWGRLYYSTLSDSVWRMRESKQCWYFEPGD